MQVPCDHYEYVKIEKPNNDDALCYAGGGDTTQGPVFDVSGVWAGRHTGFFRIEGYDRDIPLQWEIAIDVKDYVDRPTATLTFLHVD